MPGASRARRALRGPRKIAARASGAPIVKQRCAVLGSNGPAVEMMPSTRLSTSATGPASSRARSVGFTPLGVFRNSGSCSRRRSRRRPWLTAEGVRLSLCAARATWASSSTVLNNTRRLRSMRRS
jgi:hypothetical protein